MTLIYHITHFDNLANILAEDSLVCDAEADQRGLCKQSIAHATLKEYRARTNVRRNDGSDVAAGGVLADYVPFYFTNRSPMLFSIHKGNVVGYDGGQKDVVYLVSSVEAVAASNIPWCFTDGHAVEEITEFYNEIGDLGHVDWPLIRDWRWKNTLTDPDRKRRKQAEFLVHQRVPWSLVSQIGVISRAMAQRVSGLIASSDHRPPITVEPNWYYNI